MRLLGIIATHWEWVELILEKAVAEIMSFELERVNLLTANIGFHAKCGLILVHAAQIKQAEPATYKEIASSITELKNAYTERNKYIHSKWNIENGVLLRHELRTKNGKLVIAREPTDEKELCSAAQQIYDAGDTFIRLHQRFGMFQTK